MLEVKLNGTYRNVDFSEILDICGEYNGREFGRTAEFMSVIVDGLLDDHVLCDNMTDVFVEIFNTATSTLGVYVIMFLNNNIINNNNNSNNNKNQNYYYY